MEPRNILTIVTGAEFRQWLTENHDKQTECWMIVKKGKDRPQNLLWYLDAVEEVLCFGWIDTTHKG